ncbi:right-handed parallel beta-helix repeat-containing protein [bacterium]|nr:MAG: right-handed parallel beta-helix repeat-containing protein [bacterium]
MKYAQKTSFAIALCLAILFSVTSRAEEQLILEKNTEWSGALDFKTEVVVKEGVTLTVRPGTKAAFGPGARLIVLGSLSVEGSPGGSVYLGPGAEGEKKDQKWGGIVFGGVTSARVSRARIVGAEKIEVSNSSVTFSDSVVEKGVNGFFFVTGGRSLIEKCRISDMSESGVTVTLNSLVEIYGSSIERCKKTGVSNNQHGAIRVGGCTVTDCETGISVTGDQSVVSDNTVKKCVEGIAVSQGNEGTKIHGNTVSEVETGIYCFRFASPEVIANTITKAKTGIKCFQTSNPVIAQNRLEDNKTAIACLQMCRPVIEKNQIEKNGVGVYLHLSSYAIMNSNNFDKNRLHVELDNMSADWERRAAKKPTRSAQALNEQLVQKGRAMPEKVEEDISYMGAVEATGNWWGEATTAEMKKKGAEADISTLKDYYDVQKRTYEGWEGEYVQDKIDYSGYLSAPVADAGPKGLKQ